MWSLALEESNFMEQDTLRLIGCSQICIKNSGVVVDMYTIPIVYSVKKAYGMLGCVAKNTICETSEVILPLHSELVTLISSPGPGFGRPSAKQRQWQHNDQELGGNCIEEASELDLFCFKNRKLSKYLTTMSNYFSRVDRKNPNPPQEAKWKHQWDQDAAKKTQADIQRKFFITGTVKHRSRSLEGLWNLHTWKLVLQQVTTRRRPESPLNLKLFLNFML